MSPGNERGPGRTPILEDITTASSPHHTTAREAQATLDAYAEQLATRARDTGLQSAERNDAEWVEPALDWIYDLPTGTEVCADDVRREFGASSAMGSVFRTARRRGVLQAVGLQESTAISRHRGLQRVWRRT